MDKALLHYLQRHIHHLAHPSLLAVRRHHHRPQARVVEGDGCGRRAVQQMQRRGAGRAAFDDHQRPAGDIGQGGQRGHAEWRRRWSR